ncbi:MAG: 3-hydroxyacyl-CoA dehydrogenase NAD-binding domain-containing protein [Acidobacteriaceae bacterium]
MALLESEQMQAGTPQMSKSERVYDVRRVAVLGAGTMGARIAAHVANAGLPVLLLDIVPANGERNSLAVRALEELKKAKPAAFADASFAAHVRVGNFEDDLEKLKDCDWVIEAVAENMEIKRALLAKVATHLRADAILTTNTSGLPVGKIAEALPEDVRRRWFGTHFFNPPRYMRLFELIATPEMDPKAVAAITEFADKRLGKTVVPAKDVPNFIANRIGTFFMLNTVRIMKEQGLSVEEIDVLTGSVMGWPKTGTFRLSDMVGIDVLASVAKNFAVNIRDERADVTLPAIITELVERKWLGDKTRQGFYKKERGADGKEARLVLDFASMEYKPAARAALAEIEMAKTNDSLAGRIRALLGGNPAKDKVAKFYWTALPEIWAYAANRIGEVADTIVEIDRAMKAGFNWELGPFAMWDAAGVPETVAKMRELGEAVPAAVEKLLAAGGTSWYRNEGAEFFDVASGAYRAVDLNPELAPVANYKRSNGVFAKNAGISLMDVGDGIGCFEFHSKMNSLGQDIVGFIRQKLQPGSDAVKQFDGFIITNDAQNFSVGANLMQLLLAVQDQEWDDIDLVVREFQNMTQAIKFCPRPVVSAPFGMCLGGGTEISMHSAVRQPHVELYSGLVETGVGILPAGGGCKEMVLRALDAAAAVNLTGGAESVEVHEAIKNVFETVAMAKVSTSAYEARGLRILEENDAISMNRDRLVSDAKAQALRLVRAGYTAPAMRTDIAAPGASVEATLKLGVAMMLEAQYISPHDAKIANRVARVLTGGGVTAGTLMSEQYLLDLEREGFLALCGEAKTVERIGFTLKTGKPLRN